MQVIRLVWPGRVDKVIAFDSLPEVLLKDTQKREPAGFPRHWKKWLFDNGCRMKKMGRNEGGNPVEKDWPAFYILDYLTVNTDKQTWASISQFVRRVVDLKVRLTDKLEDMAAPFAADSYSEIALEPEEVPVIPIPKGVQVLEEEDFSSPKKEETFEDTPQEKEFVKAAAESFKCDCGKSFETKIKLKGHKMGAHRVREKAVA